MQYFTIIRKLNRVIEIEKAIIENTDEQDK
jgi:hypothetical protein